MTRPGARNFREDIRIGVKVGLIFAAAFSVIATSSYILIGNTAFVARFKVGFPTVLACYLLGGLAGGLIIGLFRPLRSTAIGSFFIGTVGSVPLILCIIVFMLPRSSWYPIGVISGAITALIMGGGIGAAMHGETKGWTEE